MQGPGSTTHRDLDFAPEPAELEGLELLSIPSIALAADASIQIPLIGIRVLGFHLEANTHAAAPKIAKLPSSLLWTAKDWQGEHIP